MPQDSHTSGSFIEPPITFERDGRGFRLTLEQVIPRPRSSIFPFFADASNLEAITPPHLRFRIVTPTPIDMKEGVLIDYRLRLYGLPIRWRTLISAWDPPHRFVDEQLRGPYRWWIHEHTFEPHGPNGEHTLCRDRVRYGSIGGAIVDRFFLQRDLRKIFGFRARRLAELLPAIDVSASDAAGD
jgi:ligand-binding SRPBCC domain-containing protein